MDTKEIKIDWRPEIDNWKHTSKDLAEFFFSQAEKLLKETIEISDSITERAYNIILILIPLVSILVGFIVGYKDDNPVAVILSGICVAGFLYSLYEAALVFHPKNLMFLGSEPKKLIQPVFIVPDEPQEIQIIEAIYSECANYQIRIEFNDKSNKARIQRIKRAIIVAIASPILSLFIFLVIAFLA